MCWRVYDQTCRVVYRVHVMCSESCRATNAYRKRICALRWFLHFSLHSCQCPCAIFAAAANAFWLHKPKEAAGALNISSEHMQYMRSEERWKSSRVSCVTSTRSGLYIHGSPQREQNQKSSTSAAACTLPARNSTKRPRHLLVQQVVRDCGRLADRPASMPGSSWSDARWHGARE